MTSPPLVSFLVAGVQKAGTTALFEYLAETGTVALPAVKEAHFFDDEARDWRAPDYGPYHALFGEPDGRPCGEATPIYIYWPRSLERIRAYNPAMRLVILLRDPVERAWSHWRMEFARGAETRPFPWCVRAGRQRLFDGEPWGFHREFSYVERGFYGDQLERLLGLFPLEQLLILRAEDLRREPDATLRRVSAFVGARAPARRVTPRTIHPGREIEGARLAGEDAAFLRGLYARDDARLRSIAGFGFG